MVNVIIGILGMYVRNIHMYFRYEICAIRIGNFVQWISPMATFKIILINFVVDGTVYNTSTYVHTYTRISTEN